jgi:hypothetical protein
MKWTFFTHRYPILTKNQATWYIPSPQKNKMITGQWQTKETRDWMVIWGIAIGMTSWFGTDLLPPRGAGNYRDSGYIFPGPWPPPRRMLMARLLKFPGHCRASVGGQDTNWACIMHVCMRLVALCTAIMDYFPDFLIEYHFLLEQYMECLMSSLIVYSTMRKTLHPTLPYS